MNTYREILEMLTSKKKIPNRTLSIPESKVRGSPVKTKYRIFENIFDFYLIDLEIQGTIYDLEIW